MANTLYSSKKYKQLCNRKSLFTAETYIYVQKQSLNYSYFTSLFFYMYNGNNFEGKKDKMYES